MDKIAIDIIPVVDRALITPVRYYRLISPTQFYVSSSQHFCQIERGFVIDTTLLPRLCRHLLRPRGKLGLIAAVYTKLLESPYLFDEIQQKPIRISRSHCHVIVSTLVDKLEFNRLKAGWIKTALWWGSVIRVGNDDELPENKEKSKLEQEWRKNNPPQFRSI